LERPEEPSSIALLVEYSASSGYFLDDLNASMQGFLKRAPEGHWYALATFSHELEIHTDFTKQTGEITAAYSQLGLPMWTEIDTYDAVYDMLDKMGRLPGRRILVIVGCGVDTFSEHSLNQVEEKAASENVTIFAAGLGSLFRNGLFVTGRTRAQAVPNARPAPAREACSLLDPLSPCAFGAEVITTGNSSCLYPRIGEHLLCGLSVQRVLELGGIALAADGL
jgi:hypothetical protein